MTTHRRILLAAFVVAVLALPASAEELVVATFGGTFVDNSKKCHAAALEKATGATVKYVLGSSVQTAAKLRAAGARSELDVAYMDSQIVKQMKAEGLLQPLEPAKIAHWSDVYDVSRDKDNYWVSMMFAGTIITYNTKLLTTPPTSWADLWKPEFKGKLAIPDISGTSGQQFLMAAARLHGGSLENIDPGFEAIKKLKPNVQMMYTQPDQIIPLFERGDIAVAVWYTDRTGAAAAKGVPVAAAYPKEGAIGIVPTVAIPKASPKRDLAQKYISILLSPEGQLCFAQTQFAGPSNKKVQLPADLAKLVPYGDIVTRMYFPDTDFVAKKFPEWSERWGREIAR
ncbi:MAG TPA: ABC transporter substrate-binding protein [Methylomirabilota bacterium]|jgi:spermidine/putrescine-binding protein|nr:ABC transporter substrate-binding protein [Methylomirabilota bacterium]